MSRQYSQTQGTEYIHIEFLGPEKVEKRYRSLRRSEVAGQRPDRCTVSAAELYRFFTGHRSVQVSEARPGNNWYTKVVQRDVSGGGFIDSGQVPALSN